MKQVLKQVEYDKIIPMIDYIETHESISPKEAQEITGKSRATAWRYLKLLTDKNVLKAKGDTNNIRYYLNRN